MHKMFINLYRKTTLADQITAAKYHPEQLLHLIGIIGDRLLTPSNSQYESDTELEEACERILGLLKTSVSFNVNFHDATKINMKFHTTNDVKYCLMKMRYLHHFMNTHAYSDTNGVHHPDPFKDSNLTILRNILRSFGIQDGPADIDKSTAEDLKNKIKGMTCEVEPKNISLLILSKYWPGNDAYDIKNMSRDPLRNIYDYQFPKSNGEQSDNESQVKTGYSGLM